MDRWNDDRLDDLHRRVINVESAIQTVAVLSEKVGVLERGQKALAAKQEGFDEKLDKVVEEPLVTKRAFWRQVSVGGLIAAVTCLGTIGGTVLVGGLHP
jgi:hypothetical protein